MNSRTTEERTRRLELDLEIIADLEVADGELDRLRGGGKTTLTTQNTDRCQSLSGGT